MAPQVPILGDLELLQVQEIDTAGERSRTRHEVPGLEGDFLQDLGRRGARIELTGVLTGPDSGAGLARLRDSFRAAEPVPFVSDIATATRVGDVVIEHLAVRELAGKPERFAYALTLRESTEPPATSTEDPPQIDEPEIPDEPIDEQVGTLVVEVIVEGDPGFDMNRVTVTVRGVEESGTALVRTLADPEGAVWTAPNPGGTNEALPAGTYTAEAVVADARELAGAAEAAVRAGETTQVTITLRVDTRIAKAFLVHFHFDSAFVEPCQRAELRRVAEHARSHPSEKLVIVGHTDLAGSASYNQSLSERRARAVFAYLVFGRDRQGTLDTWNLLRETRPAGELPSLRDTWSTREAQLMLQDLELYRGLIDGDRGTLTDEAVRSFRERRGLPAGTALDAATWAALIEAYLDLDPQEVPEAVFLPNAADGCDGGVLKWLGCGEQDPVKNTQDAWRPNRRTELIFVKADALPCEVPKPATFDLPQPGAVGGAWCPGPEAGDARCCFTTRDAEEEGKWLVQPAEPGTLDVAGEILFSDGTPVADTKYVLTAPDGEYMDGEVPKTGNGVRGGTPIPGRTGADGSFGYPGKPKGKGSYTLRLVDRDLVLRLAEAPIEDAKGPEVCRRLPGPFTVIAVPRRVLGVKPTILPVLDAVLVKKPHTNPQRRAVFLGTDALFAGSGTLNRSGSTAICFFRTLEGGSEILFDGKDNVFTDAELTAGHLLGDPRLGVTLFAEASQASREAGDVKLELTLTVDGVPGHSTSVALTAVELGLAVAGVRPAPAVDPPLLSERDKIDRGRFVHLQDSGLHAGRALVVVRRPDPPGFEGDLVLEALDDRVRLFDATAEIATPGGPAALDLPLTLSGSDLARQGEMRFFAEGAAASGGLRDTGFRLGLAGAEDEGDRLAMTVVEFDRLRTTVPSTPAKTPRLGNGPPNTIDIRGLDASGSEFDTDFNVNPPLVLVEESVVEAVLLEVTVNPSGVPVAWHVERDARPAPDGDHPDVVAQSQPVPTLVTSPDPLRAELSSNAVGSFHVRAFVDVDGNGTFNGAEPAIILNLVLVRVGFVRDESTASAAHFTAAPGVDGAGNPIPGTLAVDSGGNAIARPNEAAIHMSVVCDLLGGGGDGRRGLDEVSGGWVNNALEDDVAGTFFDRTTSPAVRHESVSRYVENPGDALPPPAPNIDWRVFDPTSPAPRRLDPPVLDTASPDHVLGGANVTLSTSRSVALSPPALGRQVRVEAIDSPSDLDLRSHLGFPAARLERFRFNLDFSAYLVFWTASSALLFSVLRRLDWRIRGEWRVNPATGGVITVTQPGVDITSRAFTLIGPAAFTDVEVRGPSTIESWARDARN